MKEPSLGVVESVSIKVLKGLGRRTEVSTTDILRIERRRIFEKLPNSSRYFTSGSNKIPYSPRCIRSNRVKRTELERVLAVKNTST